MTDTANLPAGKSPAIELRTAIERQKAEFRAALPAHISPEKFVRTVLTAVSLTPDLIECDRKSLMGACMRAASDGLVLDGREATLTIYNTKQRDGTYKKVATYIPMVAGLMKKARNSGDISSLSSQVVYEKDHFSYTLGDDEKIEHEPSMELDRGKPIAVYAIGRLKDGSIQREVMSRAAVLNIGNRTKNADQYNPDKGPHYAEWWRKTAIRRLSKYLPSSSDRIGGAGFTEVVTRDDELYEGDIDAPAVANTAAPAPKPRGRRAADKLNAQAAEPATVDGEVTDVTDTGTAGGDDMPGFLDRRAAGEGDMI